MLRPTLSVYLLNSCLKSSQGDISTLDSSLVHDPFYFVFLFKTLLNSGGHENFPLNISLVSVWKSQV